MTPKELAITIEDVRRASKRLSGRVHRTPVLTSRIVDERCGRRVFFKCENLQRGGAFKIRGAMNRILTLSEDERRSGVVAFSSGNHAQAVALAARHVSISATIVMPTDAPKAKMAATRAYGAAVVTYDRQTEDREAIARDIAEREARTVVPPYDDPRIIAGQATATAELLEQVPDLDAIVTPVGGGGLLAGAATVAHAAPRSIQAFGAEPETADDTARSLECGERVTIAPPDTIADGARVLAPGALTFPILQAKAAGVVRVTDGALVRAMRLLLTRMKLLVEPTGALGAAAVLEGLIPEADRVGVVLSGGNVDPGVLCALFEKHRDLPA